MLCCLSFPFKGKAGMEMRFRQKGGFSTEAPFLFVSLFTRMMISQNTAPLSPTPLPQWKKSERKGTYQ